MNDLINRIRENRKLKVSVDRFTFICRRPTDVEATQLYRDGASHAQIATDYVIGWSGVTEDDVVGGGGSDAIEFDRDLWAEWCADRTAFWKPISDAVLAAYAQHVKDLKAAEKK